jgi:dTDP-4-dehydrorhamnose 3,5-epimerase
MTRVANLRSASSSQLTKPTPDSRSLPRPNIQVLETKIHGCYELRPTVINDQRGFFAKIFHRPLWEELGLCTHFEEEYVTRSLPGTLRGLHFQVPPMHHHKVVLCLRGRAWDVAVDLRRDSPTFGEHISVNLSCTMANALYLPAGLAHGFCVTGAEALLYYKLSSVYSPAHDGGIRWDSAGIPWPISDPVLSERDMKLGSLDDFNTPFALDSGAPRGSAE